MPDWFTNSVEVRFLDLNKVLEDLRRAAAELRAGRSEVLRVFLFGSLVRGNWTADSDADVIVLVDRDFDGLEGRGRYFLRSKLIPVDTLVYSRREFEQLAGEPGSFLAQNLETALEL